MENDNYVVLNDEDFEKAAAEKNALIDIKEFIDENAIDTIYYETPYYLIPAKNGERAYALLREALRKTTKVGVAVFVMRTQETLAILKAHNDIIVLECLRFHEDIRNTKDLVPAKTEIKETELKMAIKLIEDRSGKFDITAYKNTYREQLLKMIQAKAKGEKIKTPQLKVVQQTRSNDLMSKLKASLKKSKAA